MIIRQGLFSLFVQPLFDQILVLKLYGLAMSGLAISASPMGKLSQIRGAVELDARLANTVLSVN